MISVEWFDNEKCENCGQSKPHCAHIDLNFDPDNLQPSPNGLWFGAMLCSDCVEDLKKRLS